MDLLCWNQDEFADIQPEIDRLARDPAASVRYQVASRLQCLNQSKPEWVRNHIRFFTQEDDNATVVDAGLISLGETVYSDFDEAFALAVRVFDRFVNAAHDGEEHCRENAAKFISDLYIWHGHEEAGKWLFALVDSTQTPTSVVNELIARYRSGVVHGDPDVPDSKAESSRARSLQLYRRVTVRSREIAGRLWQGLQGRSADGWSEAETQALKDHFRTLDNVATQLYFASGASNTKSDGSKQAGRVQMRLFDEGRDLFEALSGMPVPHISHHLIKTLELFIDIEPEEVFRLISQAIRSSEGQGYTSERMAADLFVRVVERYLADYRNIFENPERRQDLLSCLNAFVRHGWPTARRLTYRISEIWR